MLVLTEPPTLTTPDADQDAATVLLRVVPGALLLLLCIPELVTAYRAERGVKRDGQAFYVKILLTVALIGVQAWSLASAVRSSVRASDAPVAAWDLLSVIVALGVQVAVQGRLAASSTALLLFYLLQITASTYAIFELSYPILFPTLTRLAFTLILALAIFALELLGPELGALTSKEGYTLVPDDEKPPRRVSPLCRANIFSRLYFGWLSPLLKLGLTKTLTKEDLYALPPWLHPEMNAAKLASAWEKEVKRPAGASLLRAIAWTFGVRWALLVFVVITNVLLGLLQPQLLGQLLQFVASFNEEGGDASRGYKIALLMFIVSVLQTVLSNAYGFAIIQTNVKLEGALSSLLYSKVVRLTPDAGSESGTVLSVASSDPAEVAGNLTRMLAPVRVSVQLVLAFASLYQLLGVWILPGVAVLVLSSPVAGLIAKFTSASVEKQLAARDKRTRLMNDILAAMRTVKLYGWEKPLAARLSGIRNDEELHQLSRQGLFTSLESGFGNVVPFIVAFASFASFSAFSGRPLTADIAFPSLALFDLLANPIQMIVPLIRFVSYIGVSLERVRRLVEAREVDGSVDRLPVGDGREAVEIANASLGWIVGGEAYLSDVSISIKRGEFVAVVGRVAAGKTTLLNAILGNTVKLAGSISVYGSISYADQHPFILGGTIRDNILFGRSMDTYWFSSVIEACGLKHDLELFREGDETVVGERGVTLSGGQRTRISLARAAYARPDIILLDDVLSSVDAHVAGHILDKLLGPAGILQDTTRILCTHLPRAWSAAGKIVLVQNGGVSLKSADVDTVKELSQLVPDEPAVPAAEADSALNASKTVDTEEEVEIVGPSSFLESTGAVSASVFRTYLEWCTPLGRWTDANAEAGVHGLTFWLAGYLALGLLASVMVVVVGFFALSICGVRSARTAFEQAFEAVVRSPLHFFDTTPLGAIQNRFLGDISKIEIALAETVGFTLLEASSIFASVLVIAASAPLVLFVVVPLALLYRRIQREYLATSQDTNRIAAAQRGPVLSSYQETISGASTIRALGQEQHFRQRFFAALERSQEAAFTVEVMNHWLWLRLMLIGSGVLLATTLLITFAVSSQRFRTLTPSQAGLMVSYALSTSMDLANLVHSATKVETSLIAVERVRALTFLKPEPSTEGAVGSHGSAGSSWPYEGKIEFSHVSAKYSADGDLVLKDVSFRIAAGQRVGVVGRTGAGKSSLTLALFRAIELDSGSISIDGVDLGSVGCRALRSRLTILPQEAQFFQSTLRLNLDPTGTASDIQLWEVLEKAGLRAHVDTMDGGLDALVAESASNWSAGQRQLLSLARTLLRKSKIWVIDEATSAVDLESDEQVQAVIRAAFPRVTLFIIAHRIETVLDCDRILVMDGGRAIEFDTPKALLAKRGGVFSALAKESKAGSPST